MIRKQYASFKEVDQDLKILKLKKEIAVWSMKNDYERLQSNLAPQKLAFGLINSFTNSESSFCWKRTLRNLAVGYLIKRILKK